MLISVRLSKLDCFDLLRYAWLIVWHHPLCHCRTPIGQFYGESLGQRKGLDHCRRAKRAFPIPPKGRSHSGRWPDRLFCGGFVRSCTEGRFTWLLGLLGTLRISVSMVRLRLAVHSCVDIHGPSPHQCQHGTVPTSLSMVFRYLDSPVFSMRWRSHDVACACLIVQPASQQTAQFNQTIA